MLAERIADSRLAKHSSATHNRRSCADLLLQSMFEMCVLPAAAMVKTDNVVF
jgi:transcriptional regulator NrdR family protein